MKFLIAKNFEHQNLVTSFTLQDLIIMWSSVRDLMIAGPQYITVHPFCRDKYVV
jgi:hypothetical protein